MLDTAFFFRSFHISGSQKWLPFLFQVIAKYLPHPIIIYLLVLQARFRTLLIELTQNLTLLSRYFHFSARFLLFKSEPTRIIAYRGNSNTEMLCKLCCAKIIKQSAKHCIMAKAILPFRKSEKMDNPVNALWGYLEMPPQACYTKIVLVFIDKFIYKFFIANKFIDRLFHTNTFK